MPCNCARADGLKKGELSAFVHLWNSEKYVWYLFVFILGSVYSQLFKTPPLFSNFTPPISYKTH